MQKKTNMLSLDKAGTFFTLKNDRPECLKPSQMNLPQQLATHFRSVHFGGNWTSVNLKEQLADVTWQQATTKINSFNTIAALVFHMNYFVGGIGKFLQGEPLTIKDKYSFDCPPIGSETDWQELQDKTWREAEEFASLVEQLPEERLAATFVDEKYGSYYRNLQGIVEHTHYHLGQIVILKKMLATGLKA